FFCLFFFSSRRRHTRFSRDWSSDVCSSDLGYNPHYPHTRVWRVVTDIRGYGTEKPPPVNPAGDCAGEGLEALETGQDPLQDVPTVEVPHGRLSGPQGWQLAPLVRGEIGADHLHLRKIVVGVPVGNLERGRVRA